MTVDIEDKKPTEDVVVKVDLFEDKIRKITHEMRTRMPRNVAAARLDKIPCQERSVGRVVKKSKGTPKSLSNVRKL